QLRDDQGMPVMVVNSELEAGAVYAVRQPDTETFRLWEAAGTAHTSRPSQLQRRPRLERDGVAPLDVPTGMNEVALMPLVDAALHHLQQWINGGGPPPSQPRVEFTGNPPELAELAHVEGAPPVGRETTAMRNGTRRDSKVEMPSGMTAPPAPGGRDVGDMPARLGVVQAVPA